MSECVCVCVAVDMDGTFRKWEKKEKTRQEQMENQRNNDVCPNNSRLI